MAQNKPLSSLFLTPYTYVCVCVYMTPLFRHHIYMTQSHTSATSVLPGTHSEEQDAGCTGLQNLFRGLFTHINLFRLSPSASLQHSQELRLNLPFLVVIMGLPIMALPTMALPTMALPTMDLPTMDLPTMDLLTMDLPTMLLVDRPPTRQ